MNENITNETLFKFFSSSNSLNQEDELNTFISYEMGSTNRYERKNCHTWHAISTESLYFNISITKKGNNDTVLLF